MTTLQLFTQIGKNFRTSALQSITHQNKFACTLSSWTWICKCNGDSSIQNRCSSNFRRLPLLKLQSVHIPNILYHRQQISHKSSPDHAGKTETKSSAAIANDDLFAETSKLGLFAKFKLMYKKYWYVLIPVHIVTSVGWFGGFYYLSQSGVDIPSLLSQINVSESIIEKIKNSTMGHLAIAYLFYKIATPLRYVVTLGGTTLSIKYLVQAGHIKPMPTKKEFLNMYEQKKADLAAAKERRSEQK